MQQRLAAELHYLESIEESVRQLGDMERLMGVSMAQQESASLAQMLQVMEFVVETNRNMDELCIVFFCLIVYKSIEYFLKIWIKLHVFLISNL